MTKFFYILRFAFGFALGLLAIPFILAYTAVLTFKLRKLQRIKRLN